MHEILNDRVEVTVEFKGHRVHPKIIYWDKHEYMMPQINLVHSAREGQSRIFYFSVSDPSTFMKLRFDTERMEWRLIEIYTD